MMSWKKKRWEGQIFKSRHFTPSNRVVFYFSKADATRLKTGGRQFLKSRHFTLQNRWFKFFKIRRFMSQAFWFKFFKSRRFTPPYHLRRSQLVQSRRFASQYRVRRSQYFPKAGDSRLNTSYGGFNFFKSRRFTPQNRLWRFQFGQFFFQKLVFRDSKTL